MPRNNQGQDHARRLRDAGLRVTGSRLAILAELESARTHPGAEQIHRSLAERHPSLSLSTVYSTLETFVRSGLIRKVNGASGTLRVDGTSDDHDHAVCRRCGRIADVARERRELGPPGGLPRGYRLLGLRVEYDVLCGDCDRQSGEDNPST
jgi:Fur family peroxide stress response transcriptional regulator